MSFFALAALLIVLAALFAYANYQLIHLPMTIGVMVLGLALSMALIGLDWAGVDFRDRASSLLDSLDFESLLLNSMLGFLLFAGALHLDLSDLRQQKGAVALLVTLGVLASTFLVGGGTWLVLHAFGVPISIVFCLLFGALITPTDPIAVISMLKQAGVPKSVETKIAGESLFNDGVGVVVFLIILEIARGEAEFTVGHALYLFGVEAVGGALLGLAGGVVAYHLLKRVDEYKVEVLITLALVMGVYAVAQPLHVSGAIGVVCSGLVIGNQGRLFAMSEKTEANIDTFWELIDEILNAALFVLIGLEVLVLKLTGRYLLIGLAVIPVVLLARLLSVSATIGLMRRFREFTPGAVRLLTWAGLRGGISVALALSIPRDLPGEGSNRDVILAITYAVVVFSIIVQGLTVPWVARKIAGGAATGPQPLDLKVGETAVLRAGA